jgi:hypothetical protein
MWYSFALPWDHAVTLGTPPTTPAGAPLLWLESGRRGVQQTVHAIGENGQRETREVAADVPPSLCIAAGYDASVLAWIRFHPELQPADLWASVYSELEAQLLRSEESAKWASPAETESECKHQHLDDVEATTAFRCMECGEWIAPEDIAPQRECSRDACGATFASDDRNCPDCGSPFTRRLADWGCTECGGECEEIDASLCPDCEAWIALAEDDAESA